MGETQFPHQLGGYGMDLVIVGKLLLILLLVVGNAFFVGSEIALTSARRSRIKQLASTGNKSAKIVQVLHDEPERFYSVTQIGITLVSLALGAIGMVTLTEIIGPGMESLFGVFGDGEHLTGWAHTLSYVVAFIIISFLHVVGGELAPKVLAFHKAESLSLSVAWIINGLHRLMRPIIWVMNHSSNGLLWVFGQRDLASHGEGHFSMTGEEIRTILSASEQEGVLEPQLTMMLRGVFDLDEHTARDAMVPRTEVQALEHTATVEDVMKVYNEDYRERYPVYEGSVDKIIGLVSMKRLLGRFANIKDPKLLEEMGQLPVTEIMQEAYFVPDSMPLSILLKDFTSNRRQMAIVLDEYGGTEGLITLEDILEEIVGDYEDEFTPRHRHIKKEGERSYFINGGVRVTELEPKLNFPFPTGEYVTLGGLINHRLNRIARVGDEVRLEGARLKVVEMDSHRITKVLFEELPQPNGEDDGEPRLLETSSAGFVQQSAEQILKDKAASENSGRAGVDSVESVDSDAIDKESEPEGEPLRKTG